MQLDTILLSGRKIESCATICHCRLRKISNGNSYPTLTRADEDVTQVTDPSTARELILSIYQDLAAHQINASPAAELLGSLNPSDVTRVHRGETLLVN